MLPGQLWTRLKALATEDWDGGDCFPNVELQVQLAAHAGHLAEMQCAGIAQVSGWLRAFSGRVIIDMTEGVAEPIEHNHGYTVKFRGNVHTPPGGVVGVFRMHFLMVPPPGNADAVLIQQVRLELIFNQLGNGALAGFHDLGFTLLPGPGPGQHQLGPGAPGGDDGGGTMALPR